MDATETKAIPLFANLNDEEAANLAQMLEPRELAPHQVLFWLGEPGREFFVITRGNIHLTYPDHAGNEMTLAILGAGDFLGEIALLDGGPRTATARAAGAPVSLLSLNREQFHRFITQNPLSAIHMMSVLGGRQRETVERLRGIRNVNEVLQEQSSRWQRISAAIAAAAASEAFLMIHAILFGAWIIMNIAMGKGRAPDPFPFPFLCFWTSCEAIFLSLFILVSQNIQGKKDRIRTDIEYQVALKMQVEIMQLHQKIDHLPEEVIGMMSGDEQERSRRT